MNQLSPEAKRRQDAARVKGRFGEQQHTHPDPTLPSADESRGSANELLVNLADKYGEDSWTRFQGASPVTTTDDEAGKLAGRFLCQFGLATTENTRSWLDAAYRKGQTGNSFRPYGATPLMSFEEEDDLVASVYGDGATLGGALQNDRTGVLLLDLLAAAHRRGLRSRIPQ